MKGNQVSNVRPSDSAQVYRHLLVSFARAGQPPPITELAARLKLSEETIEAALNQIEARGSIHRDPRTRALVAAYPFSATPTDHVVRFADGHSVFAMCAIDALGMPVMLDADATIESRCAHCARKIRVTVQQNTLGDYTPRATKVWYIAIDFCCVPALDQCPSINFFCSAEHLDAWRAKFPKTQGEPLTMEQAFTHGARVFGSLLKETIEGGDSF